MASNHLHACARTLIVAAAVVTASLGAPAGCTGSQSSLGEYHRLDLPAHSDSPALSAAVYRTLVGELRSGDLILGVKEDPITTLVRLATIEPTYFTHSGTIEIVEDGRRERSARVWHAIGDFSLLHLSPHVLGKVRGGVRSIPLERFIDMYDALAIVRLPDAARNQSLVDECRRLQREGVPFDPFADCLDHSSICCTELTAMAIVAAGYDVELQPLLRTPNQALSELMTGWNITAPAIYAAGQFERLPGARPVAIISKYGRMETYLAMRDASALLHERVATGRAQARDFTAFDRRRLDHFTPRMNLYLQGVEGLARTSPTTDSGEIRRRNQIVYQAVFDGRDRDGRLMHTR